MGFATLTHMIGNNEFSNDQLHFGEAENSVASQSFRLEASAVQVWC